MQFGETSPLDELVRTGAQRMLQAAIETEVNDFLGEHALRRDVAGKRQVVRNGYLPARKILTGAGPLEVEQPRVRDNSSEKDNRVQFSSKILPPYLRRSRSIAELIPWLYLKGISTGDFSEALQALAGPDAAGLGPNVIVRLKEQWSQEYDVWSRRDLSEKEYVYLWVDGIHVNVRLEDEANRQQCLLVVMGATVDGHKELVAVVDGYRESEQSWYELLLDLKRRGLTKSPKLAVGDGRWASGPPCRRPFPRPARSAAGFTRRPTSSTNCPRACSRGPRRTSIRSGWPRRVAPRTRLSMPSWKNTGRNIQTPVIA